MPARAPRVATHDARSREITTRRRTMCLQGLQAYTEQVGSNRQAEPSQGLKNNRYALTIPISKARIMRNPLGRFWGGLLTRCDWARQTAATAQHEPRPFRRHPSRANELLPIKRRTQTHNTCARSKSWLKSSTHAVNLALDCIAGHRPFGPALGYHGTQPHSGHGNKGTDASQTGACLNQQGTTMQSKVCRASKRSHQPKQPETGTRLQSMHKSGHGHTQTAATNPLAA
jgi:hypothetical protein